MIETAHIYESCFSETEVLMKEVEQRLLRVVIEYLKHDDGKLSVNGLKLNKADTVMKNYLWMIEVTHALEGLLDKIRNNEIAFNGYINSLVELQRDLKQWLA